jgi:hypothetical protein
LHFPPDLSESSVVVTRICLFGRKSMIHGFLVFKGKELVNHVVWLLLVGGEPTLLDVALALERVMNSGPLDHA